MPPANAPGKSRLSKIYHRLTFALGLGVTLWVVLGYIGTRMRRARIELVQGRQRADRVKQHFTSTMSNITFTVYALLPTLSSQILESLDVESLTEELQKLAAAGRHTKSNDDRPTPGTSVPTDSEGMTSGASSTTLESDFQSHDRADEVVSGRPIGLGMGSTGMEAGIGASWASEFVNSNPSSSSRGVSTDVSISGGEEYGNLINRDHERHHMHDDPHQRFNTPGSHMETLHTDLELETATDMSTSMSNITSDPDPSPDSQSGTGSPRRNRSRRGIGGGAEEDDDDVEGGSNAFDGPRSPESRYLRSPSRSPRRSRRVLPSRGTGPDSAIAGTTAMGHNSQRYHGIGTQRGGDQGSSASYAEVVQSGPPDITAARDEDRGKTEKVGSQPGRTKAQLWTEIKIQAITRTVMTFYLVPLLTIQTTSQLTLLARLHHLRNLTEAQSASTRSPKDPHALGEDVEHPTSPVGLRSKMGKVAGEVIQLLTPWRYFSLESMGLDGYTKETEQPGGFSSGLWSIGTSTASYLSGTSKSSASPANSAATVIPLHARLDVETERNFLSFSWWLLHVGWRELEEQVRSTVVEVFKPVGLKRELAVYDWLRLLDEVKFKVDGTVGQDFHDLLWPPADPAEFERLLSKHGLQHACPIPLPPYHGPLAELLDQTSGHARSADFTYLLSTCYDRMKRTCLDHFASQVYAEIVLLDSLEDGLYSHGDAARIESLKSKRLVECLPFLTDWSRSVWAKVPDEAVERASGLPEVEGFATLIYADFASGT